MSSFNIFRVNGTVDLWEQGAGSPTVSVSGNYWNALLLYYNNSVEPLPSETVVTSMEPSEQSTSVTFSDDSTVTYDNSVLQYIQALAGGSAPGPSPTGWQAELVQAMLGDVTEEQANEASDSIIRDLSVASNILHKGQGPVLSHPLQTACKQLLGQIKVDQQQRSSDG